MNVTNGSTPCTKPEGRVLLTLKALELPVAKHDLVSAARCPSQLRRENLPTGSSELVAGVSIWSVQGEDLLNFRLLTLLTQHR